MGFCTSRNKGHIPVHIAVLCTVISADAVANAAASGWLFRTHYDDDDESGDDLVEMHVSNSLDFEGSPSAGKNNVIMNTHFCSFTQDSSSQGCKICPTL